MPSIVKIKELFDHHFAPPFLPAGLVKCDMKDGLLRIKILRRDIEIDETGKLHSAGTDISTDDKFRVDCTSDLCNWTGYSDECDAAQYRSDGALLCPKCSNHVEPVED